MANDLNNVSEEAYALWLREAGMSDPDSLSEENLAKLFTITAMETDPEAKAQSFVDIANMAMAMADKTLGSQVPVAKCLVLDLH